MLSIRNVFQSVSTHIYCNVKIHVIKYTFPKQASDLCPSVKALCIMFFKSSVYQICGILYRLHGWEHGYNEDK